jgi:hypothetical protein
MWSGFPRRCITSAHDSRRLLTFHVIYQETNRVELKVAAPRATEMTERLCGMANAQGGIVRAMPVEGFGVSGSPTFASVFTVLHSLLICSLCTALCRSLPSALLHALLQFLVDSMRLSRNGGERLFTIRITLRIRHFRHSSAIHPPRPMRSQLLMLQ